MRWKNPEIVSTVFAFSVIIVTAPIWIPALGITLLVLFVWDWIEKRTAPKREWHNWYAWRPVRFNSLEDEGSFHQMVWLETVHRRRRGNGYMEYRSLDQTERL